MFNNLQNLFQKYSQNISLHKNLEEKVLLYLKESSCLFLIKENIKIDNKNNNTPPKNIDSAKLKRKVNFYYKEF